MFEPLLGCDSATDHESPKSVLPLFRDYIEFAKGQIISNILPIIMQELDQQQVYVPTTNIELDNLYQELQQTKKQLQVTQKLLEATQKPIDLEQKQIQANSLSYSQFREKNRYGSLYRADKVQNQSEIIADQLQETIEKLKDQLQDKQLQIMKNNKFQQELKQQLDIYKQNQEILEGLDIADIQKLFFQKIKKASKQDLHLIKEFLTNPWRKQEQVQNVTSNIQTVQETKNEVKKQQNFKNYIYDRNGYQVNLDNPELFTIHKSIYTELLTGREYFRSKEGRFIYKDENDNVMYRNDLGQLIRTLKWNRKLMFVDYYDRNVLMETFQLPIRKYCTNNGQFYFVDDYENHYTAEGTDKIALTDRDVVDKSVQPPAVIDFIASMQSKHEFCTFPQYYQFGVRKSVLDQETATENDQTIYIDKLSRLKYKCVNNQVFQFSNNQLLCESSNSEQFKLLRGLYNTQDIYVNPQDSTFRDTENRTWYVDIQAKCYYQLISSARYVPMTTSELKHTKRKSIDANEPKQQQIQIVPQNTPRTFTQPETDDLLRIPVSPLKKVKVDSSQTTAAQNMQNSFQPEKGRRNFGVQVGQSNVRNFK
ncbi:Conserved_hypothetical protein [Hexamita inflata]|uniref:Uncharacterized protein n=1 Tax=Hexamita inflata TaxID=28002 RepID=A0ABP1KCK7_9EUKA